MKFIDAFSFTFCIYFSGLYTLSIAKNLKDIKHTTPWTANRFAIDLFNTSRMAKSYNEDAYGSNDYENDYYYDTQAQDADERFYSILLNDVSEIRRQLTETESAVIAAIPGLAALFGVIGLAYDQANIHNNQNNQINDALNRIARLEMEQTSICSSINQVAGINLAKSAESNTNTPSKTAVQLNLIEEAINQISAGNCA